MEKLLLKDSPQQKKQITDVKEGLDKRGVLPANTAKNGRPILSRFLRRKKKLKIKTFLTVAPEKDALSVLLESIYTTYLLKNKQSNFSTAILVHPLNQQFVEQCELFDKVFPLQESYSLRREIIRVKPDILHSPSPVWKSQYAAAFSGAGIKIGGSRSRLVTKLLNFYNSKDKKDLEKLQRKGLNLLPEIFSLPVEFQLETQHLHLPKGDFIWLSIFNEHNMNGEWPPGHAARLARLLAGVDIAIAIPTPVTESEGMEKIISYFKRNAPSVSVLRRCSPQDRLAGMLRSQAVIGPAGPETLLAAIVKKSVVSLQDMNSYSQKINGRRLKLVDEKYLKNLEMGKKLEKIVQNPMIFEVADSLQRHIKPPVDDCAGDCNICAFSFCLEHISPERVFESVKKILYPF